jgi:hypothetical protein
MHLDSGATIEICDRARGQRRLLRSIARCGGGAYQTDSPRNLRSYSSRISRPRRRDDDGRKRIHAAHRKPDPILKDLAGRQMPRLKGYVSTETAARDGGMFIDRAGVGSQ